MIDNTKTIRKEGETKPDLSSIVLNLAQSTPQTQQVVDNVDSSQFETASPILMQVASYLIDNINYAGALKRLNGANAIQVKSIFAADYFLSCINDNSLWIKAKQIIDDPAIESEKLGMLVSQAVKDANPKMATKMEEEFKEKIAKVEQSEGFGFEISQLNDGLGEGIRIKNSQDNTSLEHRVVGKYKTDALRIFFDGKKYKAILNVKGDMKSKAGYEEFRRIVEVCNETYPPVASLSESAYVNFLGNTQQMTLGKVMMSYNEKSKFNYRKSNFQMDDFSENKWYKTATYLAGVGVEVLAHYLVQKFVPAGGDSQAIFHLLGAGGSAITLFSTLQMKEDSGGNNIPVFFGIPQALTYGLFQGLGKLISPMLQKIRRSAEDSNNSAKVELNAISKYGLTEIVNNNTTFQTSSKNFYDPKEAIKNTKKIKDKTRQKYDELKTGFIEMENAQGLIVKMESESLQEIYSLHNRFLK